ncbi:MAG: discoidin domain-containing protein, partial [Gemmatimonadetes bacterium]|nr:discoidin domain-containing protein [Gemmatimonadota bacterium]
MAPPSAALRPAPWLAAVFTLLVQAEILAQTSYRLDRSRRQISVDTRGHWESWHFPEGSVTISPEGVQPRRWRLNTNAVSGIVHFLRDTPPASLAGKAPGEIGLLDAIAAGSNREGVVNVLDGDPATYWEPEAPEERSDLGASWWFRIDLGRIVVANRIVVTFVDEELGDPFYLFEVLTSDGQAPISARGGQSIDFLPVLQMVEPNTTRRRFEVDFTDAPKLNREMVVRFIQVIARGSRLDRGLEVDAGEYERLQEEDPGAAGTVEFIKLGSGGREIAVSRENWDRLPDETRGPVRYFRREQPRLAEIEVWEEGEDIARDLLDRGGSISSLPKIKTGPKGMFDGDIGTNFPAVWNVLDDAIRKPGIVADLGSFFWVKSVRIVQSLTGALITFSLGNHQIDFSDGSRR